MFLTFFVTAGRQIHTVPSEQWGDLRVTETEITETEQRPWETQLTQSYELKKTKTEQPLDCNRSITN